MGNLGHDSFWDLNHDGKLSGMERALRDQEIISDFNAMSNVGKYSSGSKNKPNNYNKNSISDNFIAFFGAAFIAVVCFVVGIKFASFEGEFTQTSSVLLIIAGVVCAVYALYFIVQIIDILVSKK